MTKKKKTPIGKFCKDCLTELNEDNTNEYDISSSQYVCQNCSKTRSQQRYINRKELIREQQRVYDLSCKQKVIEAYGGKCACCGENTIEFLIVDHINNDGTEDGKNNNKLGGKLYRWLIKNSFPKGSYQILCYNCSCAKGFFGYCPHNKPDVIVCVTRNTHPKKESNLSRS